MILMFKKIFIKKSIYVVQMQKKNKTKKCNKEILENIYNLYIFQHECECSKKNNTKKYVISFI